ncbi:MAG: 50S ribosomal protein L13 [Myxococcales bacterium]|nr:MAG: 50S ribosomal protein L13 [Myxococcales bacterium]
MRTYSAKPNELEKKWYVVDLQDVVLGRAATQIATILRGKHKPSFTPHVDCGDFVVVINAGKVHVTGKKLSDKIYFNHSQFPGGMKKTPLEERLEKNPERIIVDAVKRMLPKNRLGRALLKKLKVYATGEHPHQAQKPEALKLPY